MHPGCLIERTLPADAIRVKGADREGSLIFGAKASVSIPRPAVEEKGFGD